MTSKKYSLIVTQKEIALLREMIKWWLVQRPNDQYISSHTRDEVIEMLGSLHVLKGGEQI